MSAQGIYSFCLVMLTIKLSFASADYKFVLNFIYIKTKYYTRKNPKKIFLDSGDALAKKVGGGVHGQMCIVIVGTTGVTLAL